MDVAYINPFISSIRCTLKDMAHVSCIVGAPFRKRDGHRFHLLYSHAAIIRLSGPVTGLIAMDFAQPVALALATAFAGEEFRTVTEDCADSLRELINVVAGAAKRQMPGGQIEMSIAELVRTHEMHYPPGVAIIVIPFDTDHGRLVMEVALQQTPGSVGTPVGQVAMTATVREAAASNTPVAAASPPPPDAAFAPGAAAPAALAADAKAAAA